MKKILNLLKGDFKTNKYFLQRLFFIALRFSRVENNFFIKIVGKVLNFFILQILLNCDIPSRVKFGENIRIPHPYNIIIKEKCIIGNNVNIFHEVTIGNDKIDDVLTVIEDDVYIGCNTKIIGIKRIIKGTKIGACSLVLKDVDIAKTIVGVYK